AEAAAVHWALGPSLLWLPGLPGLRARRRAAPAARGAVYTAGSRVGLTSLIRKGGDMLFDFSEAERNTMRRALEIYLSDLREEIVKTEKHEWREQLQQEKKILEGVIEQLSV